VLTNIILCLICASAKAGEAPRVIHAGVVAPDIIAIRVQAGRVEYGSQIPYVADPGDRPVDSPPNRMIERNGRFHGFLVGADKRILYTPDRVVGDPLDQAKASRPASYRISSGDDPAFRSGVSPLRVSRKSKASDLAREEGWKFESPTETWLYLHLPRPLAAGRSYTISFTGGWLPGQKFKYDPASLRSEAVHVTQVGFRPDDPAKVAFLSCWLGDGGPLAYADGIPFRVVRDTDGRSMFDGKTRLSKRARDEDEDNYKKNYNGTDVFEMDFSSLKVPGLYRVVVSGVGCSYPFEIGPDAWRKAFRISARGFYHQRSGIPLGPPYTEFKRPRSFHPADGVKVYQATCRLTDSSNGLNAKATACGELIAGKTDAIVPDAWGGYMDAGDWDRRIQHLDVTRLLLDLADLYPDYFAAVDLNIPESGGPVPDIVAEALFNLDFYRRIQTPEGGVRGGIESENIPRHGEGSWQESLTVMAYAPCPWASYLYAGAAVRAARVVAKRAPGMATAYMESALRAIAWADAELSRSPSGAPFQVRDARNLAAAELLWLTGEEKWHRMFKDTTMFNDPAMDLSWWDHHDQVEAAWVYLRTDESKTDRGIRANCLAALVREADAGVAATRRTGFRFAKREWIPAAWGLLVRPHALNLVRAHFMTGEEKYLRAAVLACQVGAGANPVNMCYTTGLGRESPRHPLHIDSRITHQDPPPGITVFGPADPEKEKKEGQSWALGLIAPYCHPAPEKWPGLEAFWDVFWYPSVCEFTPQSPMAENAYVWGYLAARP